MLHCLHRMHFRRQKKRPNVCLAAQNACEAPQKRKKRLPGCTECTFLSARILLGGATHSSSVRSSETEERTERTERIRSVRSVLSVLSSVSEERSQEECQEASQGTPGKQKSAFCASRQAFGALLGRITCILCSQANVLGVFWSLEVHSVQAGKRIARF
jgi:hypothetical protein